MLLNANERNFLPVILHVQQKFILHEAVHIGLLKIFLVTLPSNHQLQSWPCSSRRHQFSCLSRQHANIVDETFDKEIVVVWLATHSPATLLNDGTGVQLDFQLMNFDVVRRMLGGVSV